MKRPVLYLMLGYPGSGKTTTAKLIHQLTGAVHVWADLERRQRFGEPRYTHEENVQLYSQLNQQVAGMLSGGRSVVFDTNFNFYKDRENLRRVAAEHNASSVILWVKAPKELARQRATTDAHIQDTRVLGDMPLRQFERLSGNMQPPQKDEAYIEIDGTKITADYIAERLGLSQ